MSVLEIKDLSFSYKKDKVLEDINLEVKEEDFLAIIGPNGGGKSTLLKLILGINPISKGSITIFGKEVKKSDFVIGYVPQNTNINVSFPITVLEVVMMGHPKEKNRKLFGIKRGEIEKNCALSSLKKVGMEKFAKEKIGTLSGGQRQRVMIARALCSHPKILMLDEPTASIDVDGQKQIYKLLQELNESITIVVVSHDISVILSYASKVAHINKSLTYHDISEKHNQLTKDDGHFCEVEMLQMLGSCKC